VADLPGSIQRNVKRARATIHQLKGGVMRVEFDGRMVRFLSEEARAQAA
jgi:hypothetical protein